MAAVTVIGCVPGKEMVDGFTEEEFEQIRKFGPLGAVPPSPTNRFADNPSAAAFGQRLFFEKSYAHALTVSDPALGNVGDKGKVSCASCHDPASYFVDTRSRPNASSLGVSWTARNSPSLVNATFLKWGGWGGKDDSLWFQGANGSESTPNFASNRLEYAHMVFRKYRADYDALFPVPLDPALDPLAPDAARFPAQGKPKASNAPDGPWEGMAAADRDIINQIAANAGKAIEAYERLLVSGNAPIDRYVAGDYTALSPAAKRGLALFIGKAACVDCHSGPMFTDQGFHNTGVPQVGTNLPRVDVGRYDDVTRTLSGTTFNGAGKFSDDVDAGKAKLEGLAVTDDLKGKFRTSPLRHIDRTGPYMHNGSLETLEDVVQFYNWGGGNNGFEGEKSPAMVPLLLSDGEVADLVEFLGALTGDPVSAELRADTASTAP